MDGIACVEVVVESAEEEVGEEEEAAGVLDALEREEVPEADAEVDELDVEGEGEEAEEA